MRNAQFIPLISKQKESNAQFAAALPCNTLSNDISNYSGSDKYGNCYNKCSQTCPSSNCALECDRLIFKNMVTYPPPTTPYQSNVDSAIQSCTNNANINSSTCREDIINCCSRNSDITNKMSSGLPGTSNYSPSGMDYCYNIANNTCRGIDSETGINKNVPLTTFPPGVIPTCPKLDSNILTFKNSTGLVDEPGETAYTKCMNYCHDNCTPDYNCYKSCDPLLTQGLPTVTPAQQDKAYVAIKDCAGKSIDSKTCREDIMSCCAGNMDIVNKMASGTPGTSNYFPSGMDSCAMVANNCMEMSTTAPPSTNDVDLGIQQCTSNANLLSKYCQEDIVNCCLKNSNIVNSQSVGYPGQPGFIPSGPEKCYNSAANTCYPMTNDNTTGPPIVLPTETPFTFPTSPIVFPTETPIVFPTETPIIFPTETPIIFPTQTPNRTLPPIETTPYVLTNTPVKEGETTQPVVNKISTGLSTGAIIGIVVGVLALFLLIFIYFNWSSIVSFFNEP